MKIQYFIHLENYRISFISRKSWVTEHHKKLKHWSFNYLNHWPNIRTHVIQLYIFGLGFGYKKKINDLFR